MLVYLHVSSVLASKNKETCLWRNNLARKQIYTSTSLFGLQVRHTGRITTLICLLELCLLRTYTWFQDQGLLQCWQPTPDFKTHSSDSLYLISRPRPLTVLTACTWFQDQDLSQCWQPTPDFKTKASHSADILHLISRPRPLKCWQPTPEFKTHSADSLHLISRPRPLTVLTAYTWFQDQGLSQCWHPTPDFKTKASLSADSLHLSSRLTVLTAYTWFQDQGHSYFWQNLANTNRHWKMDQTMFHVVLHSCLCSVNDCFCYPI